MRWNRPALPVDGGWIVGLLLALLALLVLLPASPWLYPTPYTDTAIFLYIGDGIRQGQLLFLDLYDHKPPLIFSINALGLWLGGGYRAGAGRWGVWALQVLSLSAAAGLGFTFLRRFFRPAAALLAVVAFLLSLCFVHERGNLTEEYALPFQFAAYFLLAKLLQRDQPRSYGFGIGFMLGMASTLKQPLAAGVAAVVAALWVFYAQRRSGGRALLATVFVLFGGLSVWIGWFLYFAIRGALPAFWEAAFAYNFALSGIGMLQRWQALVQAVGWLVQFSGIYLLGLLMWFVAALHLWLHRHQPDRWRVPLLIAVVDLPIELLLSSLSGNNFFHYFMPLLPALTILTAFWIDALYQLAAASTGRSTAAVLLGGLFLGAVLPGLRMTAELMGPRGDRQIEDVARYVQQTTSTQDAIQVWGNAAGVYLLAQRRAPGKFFFLDPLFVRGYSGLEQTGAFLEDLQEQPPALIVYQKDDYIPLIMPEASQTCDITRDPMVYDRVVHANLPSQEFVPLPAGMGDVYYWVCQNYAWEATVGEVGWEIYRWKGTR